MIRSLLVTVALFLPAAQTGDSSWKPRTNDASLVYEVARLTLRTPGTVVVQRSDDGQSWVVVVQNGSTPSPVPVPGPVPDPKPDDPPPAPPVPNPQQTELQKTAAVYVYAVPTGLMDLAAQVEAGVHSNSDSALHVIEAKRIEAKTAFGLALDAAIAPHIDSNGKITNKAGYAAALRTAATAMVKFPVAKTGAKP